MGALNMFERNDCTEQAQARHRMGHRQSLCCITIRSGFPLKMQISLGCSGSLRRHRCADQWQVFAEAGAKGVVLTFTQHFSKSVCM